MMITGIPFNLIDSITTTLITILPPWYQVGVHQKRSDEDIVTGYNRRSIEKKRNMSIFDEYTTTWAPLSWKPLKQRKCDIGRKKEPHAYPNGYRISTSPLPTDRSLPFFFNIEISPPLHP
jgi:hypothetical protein